MYWRVYPQFQDQHLAFVIVSVSEQPKSEPGRFFIQGDWVNLGEIEIWRNADFWKVNAKNWQPRRLPISWQDAPPADGAFWQLQAQLVDDVLSVTNATGPFPHPPRLEALPPFKYHKQQLHQQGDSSSAKQQSKVAACVINWEELTPVSGKLELTIKINSLPQAQKVNGACHFRVECDGRIVKIGLKQKQWTKLETANTTYAEWIAAISGKMGAITSDGFVLEDTNVQVFERKSKTTAPASHSFAETVSNLDATTQSQLSEDVATQTKQAFHLTQTESVNAADKSVSKSQDKTAPSPKASTDNSVQPKSKKIGKFNVQIR